MTGSFGVDPRLAGPAASLFGDRLPLASAYAARLATDGVVRGLIGPRETGRLWDRHLLNCSVVGDLIPKGSYITDVGSGAGLPGIVLAVARPDLTIALVEPLARRTSFLTEVVAELALDNVTVVRARAEDAVGNVRPADIVTARAVAPLDRLAGRGLPLAPAGGAVWCLPLAQVGGRLLALKGATAADEVATHRAAVTRLGGGEPTITVCG